MKGSQKPGSFPMPPSQIPSHTSLVANRVYSCLPKFVGSEECFATQVWRDANKCKGGKQKRQISENMRPYIFLTHFVGLPWWLSGKESSCQCRRHGFNPRSGTIPHDAGQLLSLCSRACEPQLLSPCAVTTKAQVPTARAPQEKPPQ